MAIILPQEARTCKTQSNRAFEAELQPAINPKDFLPEPCQLSILMG